MNDNKGESSSDEEPLTCGGAWLFEIVTEDDKDELIYYIHCQAGRVGYDVYQSQNLNRIMNDIILNDAVKCATAILQGETGLKLDLNAPLGSLGMTLLHHSSASPEFIELFLRYGARTDIISEYGMIPLDDALTNISEDTYRFLFGDWSSRQSLYMTIVCMCLELEYKRNRLESVRLLFRNTKEVDKEIYRFVKDGELIKIMSLLMVAREEVTSPSLFKGLQCDSAPNRSISLRQLVLSEIVSLTFSQKASTSDKMHELKNKLETMMYMLSLNEVFERVGDKIELHCHYLSTKLSEEEFAVQMACLLISEGFAEYKDFELNRSFTPPEILPISSHEIFLKFHKGFLELLERKLCGANELGLVASRTTKIYEQATAATIPTLVAIPTLKNKDDAKGSSPLEVSLEKLCHHHYLNDWTPKQSIFKLLFILCLPQLKESLESIRLVASKTAEIETIVHELARDGKLIELASLLMVAPEKLSLESDGLFSNAIRQCIISDIEMIIDAEVKVTGRSNNHKLSEKRKVERDIKFSALLLLEVFERAGNTIKQYIQSDTHNNGTRSRLHIARDIQFLLEKAGFRLKPEDTDLNDINCFSTTSHPVDCTSFSNVFDRELWASLAKETSLTLALKPREFFVAEKKHLFGMRRAPSVRRTATARSTPFHTMVQSMLPSVQRTAAARSTPFHTMVQSNSKCSCTIPGIPTNVSGKNIGLFSSLG